MRGGPANHRHAVGARGGIFSGMKSHQDSDAVLDGLGDKFLTALREAVSATRRDLHEYRSAFPAFVAESSSRGLANWIHDRLWNHLVVLLDDVHGVFFVEKGVTREINVGVNYRIRIKRHRGEAEVSTYPTQAALEFLDQPPAAPTLPGLADVHLIGGYQWIADSNEIGPAILSCRDGKDNVLWTREFGDPEAAGSATALADRTLPPGATIRDRRVDDLPEDSIADPA